MFRSQVIGRNTAGFALAIFCWIASTGALAQELDFSFVDVELARVDVDQNETFVNGSDSLSLKTDDDTGWRAAFGWQFFRNFHVFGEYTKARNDFDSSFTIAGVSGTVTDDFDLARARAGLGYSLPLKDEFLLYSRVTWDYIDVGSVNVGTLNLGDDDDSGVGFEVGLRWRLMTNLELQGYGRYSDIGDLDAEQGFDDSILGGVKVRWNAFGSEHLAFQMGYEAGDINTMSLGLRYIVSGF